MSIINISIAAMLLLILSACGTSTKQPEGEVPAKSVQPAPAPVQGTEASSKPLESTMGFSRDAIFDQSSVLVDRVIYFDFDKSNIQSDYMAIIENHGQYLASYPGVRVRLEGHTDERGSREYNIALGERRALSVRQLLLLQGVSEDQITTISFGEELSALEGHDENAWSKNRRVELVYDAN